MTALNQARQALQAAAAKVPEINYPALIEACFKRTKAAQGTKGCVQFARGAEWFREQAQKA